MTTIAQRGRRAIGCIRLPKQIFTLAQNLLQARDVESIACYSNYKNVPLSLPCQFFNNFLKNQQILIILGTLVDYITLNVPSDHILPEMQQHLFQRRTAFQQRIVGEPIEKWHIQAQLCLCNLNTGCSVCWSAMFFTIVGQQIFVVMFGNF